MRHCFILMFCWGILPTLNPAVPLVQFICCFWAREWCPCSLAPSDELTNPSLNACPLFCPPKLQHPLSVWIANYSKARMLFFFSVDLPIVLHFPLSPRHASSALPGQLLQRSPSSPLWSLTVTSAVCVMSHITSGMVPSMPLMHRSLETILHTDPPQCLTCLTDTVSSGSQPVGLNPFGVNQPFHRGLLRPSAC